MSKNGDGATVFRFKTRLFRHPEASKTASSTLLDIPKAVGNKLHSPGKTTVEGTINGHPFRSALEPNGAGSYRLRLNKAMSKGADAEAGDTVQLAMLVPETEPAVPADFRVALTASQKAKTFWKAITYMNRHDWIRWVDAAKQSETRARRIALAIEWLGSGKRTPCCFNTYEFMLRRIYGDAYSYGKKSRQLRSVTQASGDRKRSRPGRRNPARTGG